MGLDAITIYNNLYGASRAPEPQDVAFIPVTDDIDKLVHTELVAWAKETPQGMQGKLAPAPRIELVKNETLRVRLPAGTVSLTASDIEQNVQAHQKAASRKDPSAPVGAWLDRSHYWGLVVETAQHKLVKELFLHAQPAPTEPRPPSTVITLADDHMTGGNSFNRQVDKAINEIQTAVGQNPHFLLFAPDLHAYKLELSDTAPDKLQITNLWAADSAEASVLPPTDLRSLMRDGSQIKISATSVWITNPRPSQNR